MRVFWQRVLLTLVALASPSFVFAQTGSIGSYSPPKLNSRPAFSPYLNLGRGGNPAINYFGVTRPQMETNRAFQQIEQGTFPMPGGPNSAGTAIGPDGNPIPGMGRYYPDQAAGLQTGHPSTFFYYSHYYQFPQGRAGGGGGGTGGIAGGANSSFGRPNTQATPFFFGAGNGLVVPFNPAGSNPIGGPSTLTPGGAMPGLGIIP